MKLWTKKIGPSHLMGRHETLCGKPMLGNNYSKERPQAGLCEECESMQAAYKKATKQKQTKRKHDDADPERDMLRAKGLCDGARNLEYAAEMLEKEAARLRQMVENGWELEAPVEDDYGPMILGLEGRAKCSE